MSKKFSWVLYPHHEYLAVSDEFVVKGFRLHLQGNSLQVEIEQPANGEVGLEARALADRYARLLRTHLGIPLRAITIKEFGAIPARMFTIRALTRQDRKRVNNAIRRARREILASEDSTLRRCYDYIQDAGEREKESLFYLYKAIESIEDKLGGERKAIEVLGVCSELKFVKRLANEPVRDERHAPKDADALERPDRTDKAMARDCAIRILRAYEQYVRRRSP